MQMEGENRVREDPERKTKLTAIAGGFVFVMGVSLCGGEKRQRLSAPSLRRVCGGMRPCAKDRDRMDGTCLAAR